VCLIVFSSFDCRNNSFHDHLPTSYNHALTLLLARMKENENLPREDLSTILDGDDDDIEVRDQTNHHDNNDSMASACIDHGEKN
jgi:hypothetical protein